MGSAPPVINKPKDTPTPQDACEEIFGTFGVDDIAVFPEEVREKCAESYFNLSKMGVFVFAIDRGIFREPHIVKDPAELVRSQGTYRIAHHYYKKLIQPQPALVQLAQKILGVAGEDKIILSLESKQTRENGGHYQSGLSSVTITDTLSQIPGKGWQRGMLGLYALYHELGHRLMYLLYKNHLPFYWGSGHDEDAPSLAESFTNPAAAWTEGFADGMMELESAMMNSLNPIDLQSTPDWFQLPLEKRMSNEYVVGAILRDYIQSKTHEGNVTHVTYDEKSKARLNQMMDVMQTAGPQNNFCEFVADFLALHPEEEHDFGIVLHKYGMDDVQTHAPNFIDRFVCANERTSIWKKLDATHHIRTKLLDPTIPIQTKLKLKEKIEAAIKVAASRDRFEF